MGEPKTRPTGAPVDEFLASVPDKARRADAMVVAALMTEATGEPAVMWGNSIVGFGAIAYPRPRGPAKTWPVIAFAPRKSEVVLYLNTQLDADLFARLGPHRRGAGCVYIKRLSDIDQAALTALLARSVELAHSQHS